MLNFSVIQTSLCFIQQCLGVQNLWEIQSSFEKILSKKLSNTDNRYTKVTIEFAQFETLKGKCR